MAVATRYNMLRRGHSLRGLEARLCRVLTFNTVLSISRSSLCDSEVDRSNSIDMMGTQGQTDEGPARLLVVNEFQVKTLGYKLSLSVVDFSHSASV